MFFLHESLGTQDLLRFLLLTICCKSKFGCFTRGRMIVLYLETTAPVGLGKAERPTSCVRQAAPQFLLFDGLCHGKLNAAYLRRDPSIHWYSRLG